MFAMGHEIRRYNSNVKEMTYSYVVLSGRRIQALDVDPFTKVVYWADSSEKTLKRSLVTDDSKESAYVQDLRISGIMEPNGIALDWVSK